nr:hypothetical protein [Tanacetum cinerariifolium]
MEQHLALTRGNQASGVVKPAIGINVNFEIKRQFMRELREDTLSRNKNDDAHEHIERVLDIVSLFSIPGVTHDAIMLRVFPITLTGAAKRWIDMIPSGRINTWDFLELFGGTHLDKEYPLNEEVKGVEELSKESLEDLFQTMAETGRNRIGDISLGIEEDVILFDINGNVHHPTVPIEKEPITGHKGETIMAEQGTVTWKLHSCKPIQVMGNETCRFWPTCDPNLKDYNGGDSICGMDEHDVLKQWYCYCDNERRDVKGEEMLFSDFLQIRYGNSKIDDTTRKRRNYVVVFPKKEKSELHEDPALKLNSYFPTRHDLTVTTQAGYYLLDLQLKIPSIILNHP